MHRFTAPQITEEILFLHGSLTKKQQHSLTEPKQKGSYFSNHKTVNEQENTNKKARPH
jgi:hypothetical protein